jgi:hypothetical protein
MWVGIILLGVLISVSANAGTMCNFKEQTLLTNNEGQQVLSKHRVDTCVEQAPKIEVGMSAACGIPSRPDPRVQSDTISCQLTDGSWRQHNAYWGVDQYGQRQELVDIPETDFTEYGSGFGIIKSMFAWTEGWSRNLNREQRSMHLNAIKNAAEQSSNGQGFQWSNGGNKGVVLVAATFQTSQGYCKILNTAVFSGNKQVADSKKACYNNTTNNWYWVE